MRAITEVHHQDAARATATALDGLDRQLPRAVDLQVRNEVLGGLVAEVTTTYTARATRDGDRFWLLHIPELGHDTQARNVGEIEVMARDLIATLHDLDPSMIDLRVEIELPGKVRERLQRVEFLHEQEAAAKREAAAEARAAAAELKQAGLSLRDIGKLLGVSFQRAGQLTAGP